MTTSSFERATSLQSLTSVQGRHRDVDPFSYPELIPEYDTLSDNEKEKIRQGCIQLQDAYDGRFSITF